MTTNQQRAAERHVQTAREILVACNVQPQFVPTVVAAIAAALDEAEARGRDEVAAKVRASHLALADELETFHGSLAGDVGRHEAARRIRALAEELA